MPAFHGTKLTNSEQVAASTVWILGILPLLIGNHESVIVKSFRLGTVEDTGGLLGLLVWIGVFGLAVSIGYALDSWLIGWIILGTSVALIFCIISIHPRFNTWVEFSDRLKHHHSSGVDTYEWDQVSGISFVWSDESSDLDIMLSNGKTIALGWLPEKLGEAAASLLPGLTIGDEEARKRLVIALGKLAQINCYVDKTCDIGWVAEMRKVMIPHLEKALDDSDENVRAAATDALKLR